MFTGKISRARMVHEHPVELARMEGRTYDPHAGHGAGHGEAKSAPAAASPAAPGPGRVAARLGLVVPGPVRHDRGVVHPHPAGAGDEEVPTMTRRRTGPAGAA